MLEKGILTLNFEENKIEKSNVVFEVLVDVVAASTWSGMMNGLWPKIPGGRGTNPPIVRTCNMY